MSFLTWHYLLNISNSSSSRFSWHSLSYIWVKWGFLAWHSLSYLWLQWISWHSLSYFEYNEILGLAFSILPLIYNEVLGILYLPLIYGEVLDILYPTSDLQWSSLHSLSYLWFTVKFLTFSILPLIYYEVLEILYPNFEYNEVLGLAFSILHLITVSFLSYCLSHLWLQ